MTPQHRPTRNALGAVLLTASWLFFTTEMVTMRILSRDLSVAQIGVFRLACQALVFVPILLWTGGAILRTTRIGLHLARALCSAGGMLLFYLTFTLLPFALATTVTFLNAIFVILLAALFLGERIGPRRIGAVVAGFVGVLVAMRPGFGGLQIGLLAGLAAACAAACLIIVTRQMSRTESRLTVMAYSAGLGLILVALPAALTWQPIDARHLPLLALVGLAGTTGQFLMVGALQLAEASALAPVDYIRLIFAVLAGYAVFGEIPDAWTWAGAAIIIVAVSYATHRERLAARAVAPTL